MKEQKDSDTDRMETRVCCKIQNLLLFNGFGPVLPLRLGRTSPNLVGTVAAHTRTPQTLTDHLTPASSNASFRSPKAASSIHHLALPTRFPISIRAPARAQPPSRGWRAAGSAAACGLLTGMAVVATLPGITDAMPSVPNTTVLWLMFTQPTAGVLLCSSVPLPTLTFTSSSGPRRAGILQCSALPAPAAPEAGLACALCPSLKSRRAPEVACARELLSLQNPTPGCWASQTLASADWKVWAPVEADLGTRGGAAVAAAAAAAGRSCSGLVPGARGLSRWPGTAASRLLVGCLFISLVALQSCKYNVKFVQNNNNKKKRSRQH